MGIWSFPAIRTRSASDAASIFLRDPAAMDLRRHLADSEFCRGLLVEQAAGNQWQDFAFTGGEAGKTPLKSGQFCSLPTGHAILTDRRMNGFDQFRLAERFG